MNPLPPVIRKNGFEYTLILRTERKCVYRQRVSENLYYFEVFVIRKKPGQIFGQGREYPQREAFPKNEDFGKSAWTYHKLADALAKFELL